MQGTILKIATMAVAVLILSCSTSRRTVQSHENAGNTTVRNGTIQKEKTRDNPSSLPKQPKPAREDGGTRESHASSSPLPHPEVTFSAVESANVRVPGINPLPSGGLDVSLEALRGEFCYPYRGKVISNYGMRGKSMHTGVDIKAVPGDTIRAALSGVVRMSKPYSGYGNLVVIQHWCGFETLYAHNVRNLVDVNDVVEAGQPIALAGRTGRATTEHLHFEVRAAGEPVDPSLFLNYAEMALCDGVLCFRNKGGKITASLHKDGKGDAPDKSTAIASSPGDGNYHIVRKGDTLYRIAANNGTTVKELQRINKLGVSTTLSIGQRIKLR